MIKHTQTICQQIADVLFENFVGLAPKRDNIAKYNAHFLYVFTCISHNIEKTYCIPQDENKLKTFIL